MGRQYTQKEQTQIVPARQQSADVSIGEQDGFVVCLVEHDRADRQQPGSRHRQVGDQLDQGHSGSRYARQPIQVLPGLHRQGRVLRRPYVVLGGAGEVEALLIELQQGERPVGRGHIRELLGQLPACWDDVDAQQRCLRRSRRSEQGGHGRRRVQEAQQQIRDRKALIDDRRHRRAFVLDRQPRRAFRQPVGRLDGRGETRRWCQPGCGEEGVVEDDGACRRIGEGIAQDLNGVIGHGVLFAQMSATIARWSLVLRMQP